MAKTRPIDYRDSYYFHGEDPIYTVRDVDVKPEGYEHFALYPDDYTSDDIHGYAIAQFVVEPEGFISNFEVISNTPEKIKDNIVSTIRNEMPEWKPGVLNNKKVATRVFLPVIY